MSKIRNAGISSLYLAQLKTFAVLVYGHVYIIWTYEEAKIKLLIF